MTVRIYAACLASYNNGVLHGRWIDASSDVDAMQTELAAMLRASPYPNVTVRDPETGENVPSAEEWAMHDSEGLPSTFGEYCGLQAVADYVALCEDFDHIDADALAAIVDNFGTVDAARDALDDNFCGIHTSFRDYADEAADEMLACHTGLPDIVSRYFDYAAWARDLQHDMTTVDVPSGVAVFHA